MSHTASTDYEPSLKLAVLRACECGSRHPLAFDPPVEQDTCPVCGRPVAQPEQVQTVPTFVSRSLAAAGRLLNLSPKE